jgi:hypothetical protein
MCNGARHGDAVADGFALTALPALIFMEALR